MKRHDYEHKFRRQSEMVLTRYVRCSKGRASASYTYHKNPPFKPLLNVNQIFVHVSFGNYTVFSQLSFGYTETCTHHHHLILHCEFSRKNFELFVEDVCVRFLATYRLAINLVLRCSKILFNFI